MRPNHHAGYSSGRSRTARLRAVGAGALHFAVDVEARLAGDVEDVVVGNFQVEGFATFAVQGDQVDFLALDLADLQQGIDELAGGKDIDGRRQYRYDDRLGMPDRPLARAMT